MILDSEDKKFTELVEELKEELVFIKDDELLIDKIQEASKQYPLKGDIWYFFTALYLIRKAKLGHAFVSLKKAHETYSQNSELVHLLSLVAAKLGLKDEAIYYLKLTTILQEPDKGLMPEWLPSFEGLYLKNYEERYIEHIRYLMHLGYYEEAYKIGQDLLLAYVSNVELFILVLQISCVLNLPYDALHLIEKIIDYFGGNLISTESLIIAEAFAAIGQKESSETWIREAKKNYFLENFSPHQKRLIHNFDPVWQEIKILSPFVSYQRRKALEKNYIHQNISKIESHFQKQEFAKRPFVRLGILIKPEEKDYGFIEYLVQKGSFFENTNFYIHFYIDRPERENDVFTFHKAAKEFIYIQDIDNETLAHILHNEELDLLLDIGNNGLPLRPDLMFRKPSNLHVLFAGDPEMALLWGYDAVLGDQYIYPLKQGETFDEHQHIVEKNKNQAVILRLREPFVQYINFTDCDKNYDFHERKEFVVGVYGKRKDFSDEKISFLREILQSDNNIMLIFEQEILGGQVAFQDILEKISADDESLQARMILPNDIVRVDDFVIYQDIIISMEDSYVDVVCACVRNHKIILAPFGENAFERIAYSIVSDLNRELANEIFFQDWRQASLRVADLKNDKNHREKFIKLLQNYGLSNIADWSSRVIITLDDFSYIASKLNQ